MCFCWLLSCIDYGLASACAGVPGLGLNEAISAQLGARAAGPLCILDLSALLPAPLFLY